MLGKAPEKLPSLRATYKCVQEVETQQLRDVCHTLESEVASLRCRSLLLDNANRRTSFGHMLK